MRASDGDRLVNERRERSGLEPLRDTLKTLSAWQCVALIVGISMTMLFVAVAFVTGSVAIIQSFRYVFKS